MHPRIISSKVSHMGFPLCCKVTSQPRACDLSLFFHRCFPLVKAEMPIARLGLCLGCYVMLACRQFNMVMIGPFSY